MEDTTAMGATFDKLKRKNLIAKHGSLLLPDATECFVEIIRGNRFSFALVRIEHCRLPEI